MQWATAGATGAMLWASKGWDNAARTFNNAAGQSKYGNGQSDSERGDLPRSDTGRFITKRWEFQEAFWRSPWDAFAKSDLGRGGNGKHIAEMDPGCRHLAAAGVACLLGVNT